MREEPKLELVGKSDLNVLNVSPCFFKNLPNYLRMLQESNPPDDDFYNEALSTSIIKILKVKYKELLEEKIYKPFLITNKSIITY